jgi:hypothetical protein
MAGIPVLVAQGMKAPAIADGRGCKLGTLRVRCSQAGICLRVPKELKVVPLVSGPKPPKLPKQKRSYAFALPTTLQLSRVAMSRLRQHAEAIGVNEAQLASDLLEMIARDDLYDAVLDTNAKKISASPVPTLPLCGVSIHESHPPEVIFQERRDCVREVGLAASGHVAAPPRTVMNCRRLKVASPA